MDNLNNIMALVNAGFTKADIMALTTGKASPVKAEPAKASEPEKASDPVSKPEAEAAKAPDPIPNPGVTLTEDQFTKLLQRLNVNGASIDVPKEVDISAKLGDHFKELLIGDKEVKNG